MHFKLNITNSNINVSNSVSSDTFLPIKLLLASHIMFFFLVCALILLNRVHPLLITVQIWENVCMKYSNRMHNILIAHSFVKTRRTGRSVMLFFHVIMHRDSITKLYFCLGMHDGDKLSTLAIQGIVSQSTLTRASLVLRMLCTGFKYFVCMFYYFVCEFTKLCTRFSKTSTRTRKKKCM